ncbi:TonB-dependent receptor [Sphingobium sp. HWE2-09]|uniref:TonB-dependent receptor n=1 Tax=Sphingobium sp. HWE2-09 TaxID=3108390 RepID=UPI002DCD0666|nr:TonB-dependent receptor [Sphingobium sp. HWE2-09]
MRTNKMLLLASAAVAQLTAPAYGQTVAATSGQEPAASSDDGQVADIVVTAQKRSESLNSVPISVTAATGESLISRGIADVSDLGKLVGGFKAAYTNALTPVYTLRGIGLYEFGLASSPAVTVYLDEIPLPYPVMTQAATLDLQRVEVLKGPQGLLFGQNSTGGAINYIAAKPTSTLEAGGNISYARFNRIDLDGFVSGPLTNTIKARLAVRAASGGAWQKSVTRPGDRLGDARRLQGRLLLDWQPASRLKFLLALTASRDNSDSLASQLIAFSPQDPTRADPLAANSLVPPSSRNIRAADWSAEFPNRVRDRFYQAALRTEYAVSDQMDLVSISTYSRQTVNRNIDTDGSASTISQYFGRGAIDYVSQELRLVGDTDPIKWILGAAYDHTKSDDNIRYVVTDSSGNRPLPFLPAYSSADAFARQKVDSYALFGNVDLSITDQLTAHAGVRYTKMNRNGDACLYNSSAGQELTNQFNGLEQIFIALGAKTTPFVAIPPGGCMSFTPAPDLSPTIIPRRLKLNEDNVSWRLGLDYKTTGGALIYANVSRGYKAGVIAPVVAVITTSQNPIGQERVDAYEVGVKVPLLDRRIQFNAAGFYYDYKDKQLRGRIADPVFGLLEILQNVPKSRVLGFEAEVTARPVTGLDLSFSGTYLNTKVTDSFFNFNGQGASGDFKGAKLPFTPKYSLVSDAQYGWNLNSDLKAFLGGSVTYNSATNTTFESAALPAPLYKLNSYALLDLRAGFAASDDSWRVQFFGRNITNKFYSTASATSIDAVSRMTGMPATYGVTVSVRYR